MKKGFTLIELLAVIVILSVILVIAVPQILNIIEKSRKEAFISSTKTLMSALEKASMSMIREDEYEDIFIIYQNSIRTVYPSNADIDYKGINPTAGGIVYGKEGNVILSLYNGKYCVSKTKDNEEIVIEEITENACVSKIIYKQATSPFSNMLEGLEYARTTDYANASGKQVTLNNGHSYYISYTTTLISGLTNDPSREIRILTPSFILSDPTKDGYYSRKFLYNLSSTTASVYLYGPPTDEGAGRIIDWRNIVLVDLTLLGLEALTIEELDAMTLAANWFENGDSSITPRIKTISKNIFDINNFSNISNHIDIPSFILEATYTKGVPIVLKPNTQYIIHRPTTEIFSENLSILGHTGSRISITGVSQSARTFITSNSGIIYASLQSVSQTKINTLFEKVGWIQLEEGASATTYEPYIATYRFEVTPFNKLWFDTTTNIPKKFSEGSWIGL